MHRRRFSQGRLVAALASLALLAPSAVLACEACRDAVANDPVGTALSATTLLLIGVPALLMGSIGGWIGYMHWRARRYDTEPAGNAGPPSEVASQPV